MSSSRWRYRGCARAGLRAFLSALGIAIGIGAMVAVVGVSASSQANLLALIDSLGTNLLTVSPGQTFLGNSGGAAGHRRRIDPAHADGPAGIGGLSGLSGLGAEESLRAG